MTRTRTHRFGLFRLAFSSLMIAMLVLSLFTTTSNSAKAAEYGRGCWETQIFWPPTLNSNPQYLLQGGGDTIMVSRKYDQPANIVKIVLKTPNYITWWKGITVFAGEGPVAHTYTQDSLHQNSTIFTFDTTKPSGYYVLSLMKARYFGVHAGTYCLGLDNWEVGGNFKWGGSTLIFDWKAD